jgi:EAL domain-containing protein (putative c-di-GMP-specific phosphodiesterase class I)
VAANTLKEMQDIGIRIALDDFGTGFSSLTYLQQFPLDILKIDQSFIRNVGRNSRSTAITLATLRMAKDLRLEVVAEGVETEEDLAFLCNHNCDAIQGYLFSPPVPADQFKDMLRAKRGLIIPRTLCSS